MGPLVHSIIILSYLSVAIAIGAASYWRLDFTMAISGLFAGMFVLACGLLHSVFTKKPASLSKIEARRIEAEFNSIHEAQAKAELELQNLKETLIEEARAREEKVTSELKMLAVTIGNYVANSKTQIKAQNYSQAPSPQRSQRNLLNIVKEAVEANRLEIHLQPVVTLPQRRVSFYECFTRLRDDMGRLIMPGEFLRVAEPSGLVGEIDNMLLLKCVQLARRMIKRERKFSMFCNLSTTSLGDEKFFIQFVDFLKSNRDLAGSIIFELPRDAFDRLGITAERNMGRLFDLGFRFSIDRCDSIDLDLRKLERMGVRYVKIAGDTLVRQLTQENMRPITGLNREFDATDVASLFARYGVDVIADRVESERTVVELLDLDLGFAQGNLFGSPKPLHEFSSDDEETVNVGQLLAS